MDVLHDVIVVGAGPAGSHAACLLAQGGAAVALVDKATFPRDKPCGGAVSRKALDLLAHDLGPVTQGRASGAWLTFGDRAVYRDAGGVAAAMTVRADLDAFLLARAVAAGARFHAGAGFVDVDPDAAPLRVTTTAGELRGRHLLAADGAGSAVRARVFGRRVVDYAPALEALVEAPAEVLARFADRVLLDVGGMPGGYGWIFGKRDHLNAGVYSAFGGAGIRGHLARLLARHPGLARHDRIRYLGHPIPIANRARAFERGRVWLLGDAAGLAEAVLGEGIYFALKSAALAADAFFAADGAPQAGDYARRLEREVLPELAAAERLARLCYAHPRFVFERIARSPYASGLFLGLVTGAVGYRECLAKAIATLPRWLAAPRLPTAEVAAI
jgi:geranylgeranyl reductase family protein